MKRFEKFTQRQVKSLINHLGEAILQVIHTLVKGFKMHNNFVPFRHIFRRAGEIRDPAVLATLLLRYEIDGINDEMIPYNGERLTTSFLADTTRLKESVKRQAKKLTPYLRKVRQSSRIRSLSAL